ncbi:MAG: hypothetical protein KKC71_10150 [Chloroflexi bacterium]|nr:hypothetical protein [Chloroflexota bacterium]
MFYSLGAPLPASREHYLNATRGNLYGIEKSARQVGACPACTVRRHRWRAWPGWAFSPRTEFDGLFPVRAGSPGPPGRDGLCGASALSHGVAGVTQSGIDAAKAVLNCRTRDLLKQNGASLTFLPSEDVSQWPEYLRRKIGRGEAAREEEEKEV